ncbi:MAG: hypothetical protein MJY81_06725 [Bacteroidaceae bacterium]|nr:hypothetical protein [Bacteroidaceae bacterium]
MSKQKFSRGLKRAIAIEYMQSGKSRLEIAEKYGLPSVNTLSSWVNSQLTPLEIREKCASLPPANVQKGNEMGKEKTVDAMEQTALIDALQKQIKKLEKDLKRSQDQNIALNTLIDIAEEQGIRIRKKSGAKQ